MTIEEREFRVKVYLEDVFTSFSYLKERKEKFRPQESCVLGIVLRRKFPDGRIIRVDQPTVVIGRCTYEVIQDPTMLMNGNCPAFNINCRGFIDSIKSDRMKNEEHILRDVFHSRGWVFPVSILFRNLT